MLTSKWRDEEARLYITKYGETWGEDLALRIYSSRLIGQETSLVLHGGGNTSVKSKIKNILGKEISVLFVKGSGWDLGNIEPSGFPGVDLEYLCSLQALDKLPDEEMVNQLRTHLINASSPTPSVEALLHAFLKPKFVDHSHADAILGITNTTNAKQLITECFGDQLITVPYVMPGFELAKVAAAAYEQAPNCKGMILLKHGLFTFGQTAKESYQRHIEIVAKAEIFLQKQVSTGKAKSTGIIPSISPSSDLCIEEVLPLIRGALAIRNSTQGISQRFVLKYDDSPEVMNYVNHPRLRNMALSGPLTPDHVIRTKEQPLIVEINLNDELESKRKKIELAFSDYENRYNAYFSENAIRSQVNLERLDSKPRIILIPKVGMIAVGENAQNAKIAADIYWHTLYIKSLVSEFTDYQALPAGDIFDVEYWSLEQAKLKQRKSQKLSGQIALVTGAAGAIGSAICKKLKEEGAEVVGADIKALSTLKEHLGITTVEIDVSKAESVSQAFKSIVKNFGGLDILVPNAGIAHSQAIEEISPTALQNVMDVNFLGYFYVMQEAIKIFKLQRTAGNIIVISSKNVFAPGAEFSAYSASKAAGHQLGKVAALELAKYGVKVNMISPDAVFGDESTPSGLWESVGPERAKAYGIKSTELAEFYRKRNLLQSVVTAEHVANAVLFFASEQTPTTGATLPVDGGILAAFPR